MGLSFKQLDMLKVSQDVLDHFDCGHPDFNYFLQNQIKLNILNIILIPHKKFLKTIKLIK